MKRGVLTVVLVVLCAASCAWAEDVVNLSGNWILDQAKSDPFPISQTATDNSGVNVRTGGGGGGGFGGGRPGGGGLGSGRAGAPKDRGPVPMVIEQHGNEIRIKNGFMVEGLICDGKQRENETQIPNSDVKLKEKTKATWKKNKLVVEKISFSPPVQGQQMQTLTKRTYSLSKDGKTLTLETVTANTMSSRIQKQIYQKQETPQ